MFLKNKKQLTVLSYGGGQDSTALMLKALHDNDFISKYIPGDFLVIMADTGNEHSETTATRKQVEKLCSDRGVDFIFLDLKYKYTSPSWQGGLVDFYERGNRIGSKAYPKTCTDKLKIVPIYNFLDEYIHAKYNTTKVGRKAAIKEFTGDGGSINVLLGIAKGEESRASKNEDSPLKWQRDCINKVYPLLDLGMDRKDCQEYIRKYMEVPVPSNCILCPFMNDVELLHMYRFNKSWLDKWIVLEANKIQANLHLGKKNLGVWGRKLLPEILAEVLEKHGHMTDQDLVDYKMSHGHCVKSKY
jgi:3'-phosphoadenosine 5'-phosphosulfate sulfotransferase (PAPS reductase)/FAD synthetase